MGKNLLDGKTILIVDDEMDVLDTLAELLPMCEVAKASSFEGAKELFETRYFDMAILDIMGVDGYELLKLANAKGVITVMLTAHAHSPESTVKSYKKGAASYVPKEEINNITTYLNDILEARKRASIFGGDGLIDSAPPMIKNLGPNGGATIRNFGINFHYRA
jgi:DNA-binding NtrC family response regulator